MAENYDLIFGQGASSQYAWSDSDYQKGWQTVGSTPPTAEQFDALQRRSDTKAKDLNNRLSPLETTASKALARVTPAANRLPYFNSSNSATTTAISDFTKTLLDDKDAATARATLGAPSTTGANASGSWNINAATATKLATARKINITGNATGAATFDGSKDVSISVTVNESKHAVSADTATHANDIADATLNMTASTTTSGQTVMASGTINGLSSLTGSNDLTSMNKLRSYIGSVFIETDWYDVLSIRHRNGATDGQNYGLLMYSGMMNTDSIKYKKQPGSGSWTEERTLLDSSNYNSYAPTKTGEGASGTWGINISGNASTATKLATASSIALTGNATGSATFDGSGNISISTNVNTATNADKLDGAHLADVYRQVGGHNTPTITSIIDWNTMKACNGGTDVRNINNTTYGVKAYGGDSDFSSGVLKGYANGSFYLTQDYTNFDKLCFLFCNDSGGKIGYTMVDVFLLNYIMTNYSIVNLLHDDSVRWYVKGYSNKGTETYKVSTKRIISAPSWDPRSDQNNCGIIDVLGIKY